MSGILILVVEDETDIRNLITLTLKFSGFQVAEAADGEEAIRIATSLEPDLILMDVRMPRMSGYEACRILKHQESTRDIPIVFLSAKGQESDINTGLDLGADAYFVKPFEPHELPQLIKKILVNYGDF